MRTLPFKQYADFASVQAIRTRTPASFVRQRAMSRSARGSRRGGSGARGMAPDGSVVPASSGAPADAHAVLEAVAANPSLQGAHVIVRQLIQKGIDEVQQPMLREQMTQSLDNMLQLCCRGRGHGLHGPAWWAPHRYRDR